MQDIKINKEIQDVKEQAVFGLFDFRQALYLSAGIVCALITYKLLPMKRGTIKTLISVIPVVPFAICGFFTYNRMTGEKLLATWFKYYFHTPKKLPCKPSNEAYLQAEKYIKKLGESDYAENAESNREER